MSVEGGGGEGGNVQEQKSLCENNELHVVYTKVIDSSVFVYFCAKTDFHSAFNDVKSPWRCHGETLPFEKCYFFRCRLSRYVNAYCKRGCVQLEISVQ